MTHAPLFWLFAGALLAGLAAISIIDARSYRIPDLLSLPLVFLGLVFQWSLGGDVRLGALGAAFGYLLLVGLEFAYEKLRGRAGLGRGDAKLLAAGGAWCTLAGLPYVVLVASTGGLLFALIMSLTGRGDGEGLQMKLPFGPFLSLGIGVTFAAFYF